MRIIATLLAAVCIVSAALAAPVKPPREAKGPPLRQSLDYINDNLLLNVNYSEMNCSDMVKVSVSDDHTEIIVKYLPVDEHGVYIEKLGPKFVYHIPVLAVEKIYPAGKWTENDRLVISTHGNVVKRIGPIWDCEKQVLNDDPRRHQLSDIGLKTQVADDEHIDQMIQSFQHVVDLLHDEIKAKAEQAKPGSSQSSVPPAERTY
jgi:hypothetical protein